MSRPVAVVALGPLLAALLSGCVRAMPSPSIPLSPPTATRISALPVSIAVVDEGWHTGLMLPATAVDASLPEIRQWFPHASYLLFGWGNRRYYMAAHPGLMTGLGALFPSSSVMLIQGLSGNPQKILLPDVRIFRLCISQTHMAHLDQYLAGYLQAGPQGGLMDLKPGPWPDSWFFASPKTYDAFHTCNTWTMRALHFAGLPVHSQGVIFSQQVVSAMERLHDGASLGSCAQRRKHLGSELNPGVAQTAEK